MWPQAGNGLPSRMVARRKAMAAPSSDWFGENFVGFIRGSPLRGNRPAAR